ncbi:MAG: glycosyltransferase family 2 protein [Vampirovibrio sp.]
MNLPDLELILITYNRANHVENTFQQLLKDDSPVRDLPILVLDNNSTDATPEVVQHWQARFPNLRYKKNKYNVGLAGNIFKAMEAASHEYVWILGDDDVYDFTHWQFAEAAMQRQEPAIILARYCLPDDLKTDIPAQVVQLTFITGGIYRTTILNDTIMYNALQVVFTLFPHLALILYLVNTNQKMYVVPHAISSNGLKPETTDSSYIRGTIEKDLLPRSRTMNWLAGFANCCTLVHDPQLAKAIFKRGYEVIHDGETNFFEFMHFLLLQKEENWTHLVDIYLLLEREQRHTFILKYLMPTSFRILRKNLKQSLRNYFSLLWSSTTNNERTRIL